MKQKYLYLCFIIFIAGVFNSAYSQTIEVRSMNSFSTADPPSSISVQIMEPLEVNSDEFLEAGFKLNGDLYDVVSPKRLKRDADFSFRPITYIDNDGKRHDITTDITASYTEPLDKGKVAKNAALSIGNFFFKGLKAGASAIAGAVKNEQGNRMKSAGVSLYEASPVSYVEKGEDIVIKKDDIFYLKFKNPKKNDTIDDEE